MNICYATISEPAAENYFSVCIKIIFVLYSFFFCY